MILGLFELIGSMMKSMRRINAQLPPECLVNRGPRCRGLLTAFQIRFWPYSCKCVLLEVFEGKHVKSVE